MAKTTITCVKPTRNGGYMILDTPAGDVFITEIQFKHKPHDCEEIMYAVKESYTKKDGTVVKFDSPRLEFNGYVLKKSSETLREKAAIAAEFGLNISL